VFLNICIMRKWLFYSFIAIAFTFIFNNVYALNNIKFNTTVNPPAPSVSPVSICGSGTVTLTASGGSPAGGTYDWYTAAFGGLLLQSSTSTTYSTTISATTNYYVAYTVSGLSSSRTAVTATVNAKPVLATAPTTPTASLYLSYPFTGNANDVSGNSNNGTLQNAPSLTADRFGNASSAYSFNGTSQYISTTTSVASPGPQNFSISVWFKTSSAGGKLVGFSDTQTGSSTSYDRHIYMSNSGQIYFGVWPTTSPKTINTITTYADGNWHHAVATLSTTNGACLYVDGALMATDATITSSGSYSGYWRVGYGNLGSWTNAPTDYYFSGSLDDMAIYNTALTPAQIYVLYGAGGGTFCPGNSLSLTANTVAGATYAWSGPGSFSATAQNPTVINAIAGTYTLVVTGSNGCTSTINVTSTQNAAPVLSTAPTSPTASLYLSYPFTGNANDVSGNSNNGTVQSAAPLATDRYGAASSAYSFNGTSQYISTTTSVASPGPQNFSISVWFKTSSAGGKLVGFSNNQTGISTTYDRHIYMSNSGQIYFGVWPTTSSKTINTITTYADGNWHHAVATLSTTNGANLYVDGALMATDATITSSGAYSGYWIVGAGDLGAWPSVPSNWHFTGSLDDIAIYNTALTASQVYTLYGGGSAPVCPGSTLSLQANTVSGATYSWSGPNSFTSALQNPTVSSTATTAMAGTYTCTVTGASGCTSQLSVTAVVNTASAAFTATSSVGVGSNANITYTGTDPSTSTYTWNFNGGTPATGTGQGPFSVQWATSGTKTITLTITNANGCSAVSTQTVTVISTYGNYAFQDFITLNTTSLGITSNLINFPALLSIQDNNLIISSACADKVQNPNGPNYDFAFVNAGSELYYQVESYNQVTGTLLVWVQVPTLTYAANNTISFYYGSKSPTMTHNAAFFANTWASDYLTVYHFNEGSTSATIVDATSNGKNAVQTNTTLATGEITGAYQFNGTNSNILSTSNAFNITGSFTLSAWVNSTSFTGYTDQKVLTNQSSYSLGGYKLSLYGGSATTMYDEVETRSATGTVSLDRAATGGTALTLGIWHYIQGIYDSSTSTFYSYLDGKLDRSLTGAVASGNNGSNLSIGSDFAAANWFYGIIDEARISNVAKSADWIKAEYKNQGNPIAFTTGSSATTSATNATAITGALTYTWTGATSTDPSVATNWNNTTAGTTNQLPAFDGSASLVIPSGLTNYPSLIANIGVYGLTTASGATLNLNGYTLSVGCNIYNSSGGQILYGTNNLSGITWNGSAATQTYMGTNTSNTAALGNMTINNSAGGTVTINNGPVNIYNMLTITKGNLVVGPSPAALTLKSTALLTASVAAIPGGSSITGTVNVERYITGGTGYRGYRLMSSPVYAGAVSSNNVYSINYLQTSIYLTGNAGGGFDKTGNPTLYLYREDKTPVSNTFTGSNFWGISAINNVPNYNYYMNGGSTSTNIPVGNGLWVFFRGNRGAATLAAETVSSYTSAPTVTLNAYGTLNAGQIIVHNWYTPNSAYIGYTGVGTGTNYAVRGFNLVGNPYASSIDWELFNTTTSTSGIFGVNIGTTIYEYNPATNSYGTYQQGGASTNNGSRTIVSGEGFFVLANNTNPQLMFNESAKVSTQNTGLNLFMATKADVALVTNNHPDQHLRLQLSLDSIHTDDIYVGFNDQASNNYVFNEDAPYKPGTGKVSLTSISSDNISLAINKLTLPKSQTTIKLSVGTSANGAYKLNMTEIKGIPELFEIWLMDNYKKDSLDIRHNKTYIFDVIADTNSYGSNRFKLVIRQNKSLAVHLLNFTAAKVTDGAQLVWKTENEQNYTNFTIERSTDNETTFNVLGGFSSNALGTYSLVDKRPAALNKYRLKMEDLNGTISYSEVVILMYSNSSKDIVNNNISVYPNPATSFINLTINPNTVSLTSNLSALQTPGTSPGIVSKTATASSSVYGIKIINISGSVVITATSSSANWRANVSNFSPGTYIIQVVNNDNNNLVGKSTFIKL
jgi:hypothetical protein